MRIMPLLFLIIFLSSCENVGNFNYLNSQTFVLDFNLEKDLVEALNKENGSIEINLLYADFIGPGQRTSGGGIFSTNKSGKVKIETRFKLKAGEVVWMNMYFHSEVTGGNIADCEPLIQKPIEEINGKIVNVECKLTNSYKHITKWST